MLDLKGYGLTLLAGTRADHRGGARSRWLVAVLLGARRRAGQDLAIDASRRPMAGVYTTLIRGVPDLVLMLLIFFGGQMLVNQIAESLGYEDYIEVSAVHRRRADDRLHLRRLHDRDVPRRHPGGAAGPARGRPGVRHEPLAGLLARSCCRRRSATRCRASATTGWCCSRPRRCCRCIGLDDLLRKASLAAGATREPFTFYLAAALIYLLLTSRLDRAAGLGRAPRRAALPAARPWTLASSRPTSASTSRGCGPRSGWWRRPLVLGCCLSVPLAVARTSSNPLINGPVWAYTYFFRGTPLLVQLFLIYYGLGQFAAVQESCLWPLLKQAWFCAAARLHPEHRRLHHRDPARRDRGHARGRDRGRQGLRACRRS